MCSTIKPNKLQETSEKTTTTTKQTSFQLEKKTSLLNLLPIKREHSIHVLLLAVPLQEISCADDRDKSHYKREYASRRET